MTNERKCVTCDGLNDSIYEQYVVCDDYSKWFDIKIRVNQ